MHIKHTGTCERFSMHGFLLEYERIKRISSGRARGYTFPIQVPSLKPYAKSLALNKPKTSASQVAHFSSEHHHIKQKKKMKERKKLLRLAEQFHSQQSQSPNCY